MDEKMVSEAAGHESVLYLAFLRFTGALFIIMFMVGGI